MTLSETLKKRGLVFQHSGDSLAAIVDGEKRTLYLGIDPTADSLQIGNLLPLILIRHLTNAGHKAIVLIGGATGEIGDPAGKDNERTLLDEKEAAQNAKSQVEQIKRAIGSSDVTIVNNADWLGKMQLIPFLRDVGKHFSVNDMSRKDTVRRRIEEKDASISYTEFSYSLLQAYDFLYLHEKNKCDLQVGGSDQWGNITAGIELVRKKTGDEVHGITIPLLVDDKTGKKFGKTESGTVWLSADKTSPYALYQFLFNTDDSAVIKYLNLFTFVSDEDIEEIAKQTRNEPQERLAGKRLAREVVILVHGSAAAEQAEKVSEAVFSGDISGMSKDEQKMLIEGGNSFGLDAEMSVVEIMTDSGLASSKREARELVSAGAVSLNGDRVENAEFLITSEHISPGLALLKKGKREVAVLFNSKKD